MSEVIEFTRGDAANHTFSMPAANYTAGGRLYFAAKSVVDDDNTDGSALIQASWDDSVVTDVTINGVAYKQWACHFTPAATNSILSNGASSVDLLGEFQFVPVSGDPVTFPPTDEKFDVKLYFDIKRKVSL